METRQALTLYLTHPGNGMKSQTSIASRRCTVQRLDAARDVDTWTQQDLVDWLVALDVTDVTKRRYRNDLRSFFSWCHWQNLISQDPSLHLGREITLNPQPTREHHWLTEDEVQTIIAAASHTPSPTGQRDEVLFRLGFTTALRASEMASLRWKAVDLDEHAIWLANGKGGKPATIHISANTHVALADWRSVCAAAIGRPPVDEAVLPSLKGRVVEHGDLVCEPRWDTALTRRGILARCVHYSEQTGIKFRPHDMRRTYGGLMADKGARLEDVQRALRHSSSVVTEAYLQRRLDDAKRAQDTSGIDF
jgi:integrase